MSDPGSDAEEVADSASWSLARLVNAAPEHGLVMTWHEIRPMGVEERQRVIDAENLLGRFGPQWPPTVMARHAAAFAAAAERLDVGRKKAGGNVNQSDANRLSGALRTFAEHVTRWVVGASSEPGPLAGPAAAVSSSTPIDFCKRIAAGEAPAVVTTRPGQVQLRFADGATVEAAWLLFASLTAARFLSDSELAQSQPDLLAAGALIMGLYAEVVWGEPVIFLSSDVGPGRMNLSPQPLQWRRVEPILRACAVAEAALSQRSRSTASTAPAAETPQPGTPPTNRPGEEQAEAQTAGSSAADSQAAAASTPPQNRPGEERAEAQTAGSSAADSQAAAASTPPPAPLDIAAFVHEATRLGETIEHRWSDAMRATIGDDVKDASAKAQSLLMQLGRLAAGEGTGKPALPAFPLTAETANGLALAPDEVQRDVQHGLALLTVMSEFAYAIEILKRPTKTQVTLPDGGVSSWWTQHGFIYLQHRGEVATRVTAAGNTALMPMFQAAHLAQAAWTAGLPEATVLYLVRALDGPVEANGPLIRCYETLATAAKQLVEGAEVPLDVLVLLARFWLDELARRFNAGIAVTPEPSP